MIYKEFGNTGIKMSALGFGAMRLPMIETNGNQHVDYDKAVPIMHKAFELGVNYIDTAPFYCEADSEVAVGKALKGYRDKVYLSTKYPTDNASYDNVFEWLEKSLKKLDTDYIDFYHMWGISLDIFRKKLDVPNGPIAAALKAKEQGLIKHLSFSFHDKPENMLPIIDSGYFETVLCQYNLLDRSNADAIKHAKDKGIGVVIMGPVGGGRLGVPSEKIRMLMNRDIKSTAEMALRFVLANENVNIALSGMGNTDMVEENAKVASIEGHMTADELAHADVMLQENKKLAELYCTGCKYCMPCEQGLNIPHIFTLMNYHKVYDLTDFAKKEYSKLAIDLNKRTKWEQDSGYDVSKCVSCGICETKCPQHLEIIKQLNETHSILSRV